jgi:hypothetical protein
VPFASNAAYAFPAKPICNPLFKPLFRYLPISRIEAVLFAFAVNFLLSIIGPVDGMAKKPLRALNFV